ncbi:MAG: hypothetical protein HYY76_01620 [Acidobacteria bacterium]|nr:hypothetical protein [Acidobacteriota bacterium]
MVVTVDAWTLRCLFNRGRFPERIGAQEFIRTPGKARRAPAKYNLGEGGVSREVYYRDAGTGRLVVRVHQFEKADGTLRDGDLPDPKELCIGDIEYHMHPGGKWWHRVRR